MSAKGFIKLHRSSMDHWMYFAEPFTKWQAWTDLLLMANYKDAKKEYKGKLQFIKAGQVLVSDEYLANRWKWSRGKVRRFLMVLETDGMCSQNRTSNGTTLTIENWGKFQVGGTTNDTSNDTTDGTTDGTYKKNSKRIVKEGGATEAAKGGASATAKELKAGEIFTDAEGFQYIVKTDGSIDRYRGRR